MSKSASSLASSLGVDVQSTSGGSSGILPKLGSLFSSGLGAYTGLEAQKKANKINLQIVRENNALQEKMFHEQMDYNSFQNQRKMLEAAGYSPYSLFGTSSVSSSGVPSLQQPTVMPENALANFLGTGISDLANNLSTFADAELKHQQARGKKIENDVLPDILAIQMEGGINSNIWQDLQNKVSSATMEDQIIKPGLENKMLLGQYELTTQQAALLAIEVGLKEYYGSRLNAAELEKKYAEAFASWQKGYLDQGELEHLDQKYKAILDNASANLLSAKAQNARVPAQNALDYANARNARSNAALNEYDLQELKRYGISNAVEDALSKHVNWNYTLSLKDFTDEQKKNLTLVAGNLAMDFVRKSIQNDFEGANQVLGLFQGLMGIVNGNIQTMEKLVPGF